MKKTTLLLLSSAMIALSACGGGGGSTTSQSSVSPPPPPPPPPPSSEITFTPGSFAPSEDFENRCEVVRTGTDSEGNPFPDIQGSTRAEKFWLRSWSNETYLWNDEIVDQDPGDFASPALDYFPVLKTNEVTASGEDKDDFHFSQPTAEFLDRRNNTASSGYGARFTFVNGQNSPPRDLRVLYTESDSPASEVVNGQVQFPRGTKILEVDGEDVVNGSNVDALNSGIFPTTAGESHTFVVQDAGSTSTRTVTIISEDITPEPVNRTRIIQTDSGKVGYMLFNTFSPFASEESLATAFTQLSNEGIDDLVLDLRYNGGGLLAVAAQLSYQIAGPDATRGKTFELLQFNEDANGTDPTTDSNEQVQPIPFIDEGVGFSLAAGTPLSSVDLPRVFILSTEGTCSASEAVINGLRGIDVEIILIGDITCGKPYGFLPTGNCGETYFTIQFRGINDKGFGDYSDGFVPEDNSFQFGERVAGCTLPDDIDNELGNENETLLSAALFYRDNNSCPVSSGGSAKLAQKPGFAATYDPEMAITLPEDRPEAAILLNNRDVSMPSDYNR